MKRILRLLKNDWELVLFWLAAALYAVVLLAWGIGFGREKTAGAMSQTVPSQPPLLNRETAFNFRKELPADSMKFADPFVFNLRPPRQPSQANSGGGGDNSTTVKPVTPQETVKPPPPEKKINFDYLGCMTTASGQKVALLKDADSGKTGFLTAGEKFVGIEIKGFTDQAVTVKDAKGTEVQIDYGKRMPVIVE